MNTESFAVSLAEILSRSMVAPGRPLVWMVIANPRAGGFTIGSWWKSRCLALNAAVEKVRRNPRREAEPSQTALNAEPGLGGLVPTTGPGHAAALTRAFIEEAGARYGAGPFFVIVTAGGDGTSREALCALYAAPAELRSQAAILRLPMGTGNDGADAPKLDAALDLLIEPSRIEYQRALRLRTAASSCAASTEEWLAFNILSVGLDAFVTRMTNKMKGTFPGDFYKLWVDIAALLYDRIYHAGPLNIRAFDEAGELTRDFTEKTLLLAMGAGGRRTYGSQKRILPDDRNVCMVKQMPLWRKLALKGLFTTGAHINRPEVLLFNAAKVEFSGEHPILAQMDGETVLLTPSRFPASIELTEPVIPALKARVHEKPADR